MKLQELVNKLKELGYPVAFSHFKVDGDNPPPPLPFITYTTPGSNNLIADNKVYHKTTEVNIELYTESKDIEAERTVEDMLDVNELPYNASQSWIEGEGVFLKIYEIGLI